MELKPGYKQTEVGVIPEDWEIQSLGNLTDAQRPISYGIVQTGPIIQNGVKCLRVVDIEDGKINNNNLITTTQTISNAYKRTILRAGDLVMPLRGKVGDVALVNKDLAGSNLTRGLALIAIRTDKCALFFKQLISSISTRNRLEQSMNGSALQEIPIATLRTFKIAFPSKHLEQTAIANALGDADALIQSLTRLIAKKRQIKQGTMQTLLNPYENGRLKAGWVVKKLGEAVTFRNGKAHEQLIDEHGEFIVVNSKFISTEGKIFKNALLALEQLNKNDVVMVMSDIPNGKALAKCFIVPENNRYTLNQRICALNSESINDIYLALILNRNKYFLSFDSGTGQTNLKKSDVLNCPIYYPKSENEQTRIATILSGMDAEIAALETKLAKYRHIKQGMMQNLLTGRIRLI